MPAQPKQLVYYTDGAGHKPFRNWFLGLRDKMAMQRIAVRLDRLELGNAGDHKSVGSGVVELRISYGPGYRVYFAYDGDRIVLLLLGGDKSSQADDIRAAKSYWHDHQERAKCR